MKSILQVVQNLLKPYIDTNDNAVAGVIAPVETDATKASKPYAIDDQLILDNVLYNVISPIAKDAALVIEGAGVNLSPADKISSEIQTLTNNLSNEVETRAKLGAHQLLDYDLAKLKAVNTEGTWTNNSYLIKGITFVVNNDLSVTFSGTSDASVNPLFNFISSMVLDEDVIMSDGVNADTYDYYLQATSSSTSWNTKGNSPLIPKGTTLTSMRIRVATNRTIANTTFKPLIKLASDPSTEFTPYAMTNRELTEKAIGSIDSTQITTITTAGGSWTATENCWLQANITPPVNDGRMAYVRINGITVITIGGQSEETPLSVGMTFPVFKGDVITTRDIGTYNLVFYKMK